MGHVKHRGGVQNAGLWFGVWFGEGDERNEHSPVPVIERPSITKQSLEHL